MHQRRVRCVEQHEAPDDRVERPGHLDLVEVALDERHIADAAVGTSVGRPGEGGRRLVDADDGTRRADELGQRQGHVAGAGTEVEHSHAGLDAGQGQDRLRRSGERTRLALEALQLVVVVAEQVLVSHGRLPLRPVIEVVHRDATGPGTLGGSVEKS